MHWILLPPFCLWFAFLNRARGSRLFNHTDSTVIGRVVSMGLMAAATCLLDLNITVFLWVFASLMLWCSPAWAKYWSAAIGDDSKHTRLWGLATMTLRQLLAAPCIIGLAYLTGSHALWATGMLLLGLPYYISGYVTPGENVIRNAELAVGALLGFLVFMAGMG